jgi:hypothetical protein
MKKLFILLLCTIALNAYTQVVNEKAKKLFTFGVDVYTDIWQDVPTTIEPKTINPGVNIFGTYNFMFGESNFSFSPGVGLGIHNLFSSSFLYTNNDSSYFVPINDAMPDLSYKKSKLVLTYFDIPMEIRFKSKSEFRIAVGFKFGFLIKGHTKYKGDDFLAEMQRTVIYKKAKIAYLEKNRYGFIARIGYKWLNLYGYYQLSSLFVKDKGPEMYPVSIGLTIIPF